MDQLLNFMREHDGILIVLAVFGAYLALQLWILPAFGVPT